jgi:hypothetical protein
VRDFESFDSAGSIIDILKNQFTNRKLFLRFAVDKTEISVNEYSSDNTIKVVTDPEYQHNGHFSIYGLSDKYIEIDMDVINEISPGNYKCKIINARRATQGRRDLRFKVEPEQVTATNFKISKSTIDVADFTVPTSIKVLLDQFQTSNSKISDFVKVDILSNKETDPILKAIKKTGKNVFIQNVADPESYRASSEDFIDLHSLYGNELNGLIRQNTSRGYKSIIIVPIIYITDEEKQVSFAYIQLISKSAALGIDKIAELQQHSYKLVDRISDANTNLISINQPIIDISRGGAKIKITDENLKKYILKAKGFIFDLLFKLQAPITIYGEIKSTYTDDKGNFFVGVDFAGNSSRKNEMKRYYSILKPMEADYKARLMKSIKS